MQVGNRVFLKRHMPAKELVEAFGTIPASDIGDATHRSCMLQTRINLMSKPKKNITAGVALTVKARAGDNLFIHKALNIAEEGDVIIVSNEEDNTRAMIGANMAFYGMVNKKIAGMIFDGPIRDIDDIGEMELPVYATGVTPTGPYKEGPGEINVPISIGGVCVRPGDIIVMDMDGVAVVPREDAEAILPEAIKQRDKNAANNAKAKEGISNRAWIDEKLKKLSTEIIDGCY